VVLDAGHGGEDGGAVGVTGLLEKDANLAVTLLLADLLRMHGVPMVLTRTEDTLLYDRTVDFTGQKKALDQQARLECARSQENAVFVSIHMNAFPKPQYHGLQVYYSPNHADSPTLANAVQKQIVASLQPDNKRAPKVTDGNIYLLDQLEIPAILVECGFLTNPQECEQLGTDSYRLQLAWQLFAGIMGYLHTIHTASA
jgi:N-acetylmuramoyl-L-alanine amidase